MFTTIGVSGIDINNLFDYPVYTTLKRIHLFSFLDSMENISIMLWMLFIINTCNINLLFITSIIKETFKIKNTIIINLIIIVVCLLLSIFSFQNGFIESYDYIVIPAIASFILLFLLFILNIKDRLIKYSIFFLLLLFYLYNILPFLQEFLMLCQIQNIFYHHM